MSPRVQARVSVGGEAPYAVTVGTDLLEGVAPSLGARPAFVVTDANVEELYAGHLGPLAGAPRHVLAAGEASKTLAVLEGLLDAMAAAGLGRDTVVVALGGGVVGDVAGLAAALFMRGVALVQCPTTLLAQVDSSVGGKTGVNLGSGKNLAGAFHAPQAVWADVGTLATLPPEELASGLGEVVKTALVAGEAELAALEGDAAALAAGEPDALARAVEASVRTKARVVEADFREAGPRQALNLGHTFGHAIEQVAGYGRVPHGVAVGVGLGLAAEAGRRQGLLRGEGLPERVSALLASLGLPVGLDQLRARLGAGTLEAEALVEAMETDKKRVRRGPTFVLPRAPGDLVLGVELPRELVLELLS